MLSTHFELDHSLTPSQKNSLSEDEVMIDDKWASSQAECMTYHKEEIYVKYTQVDLRTPT